MALFKIIGQLFKKIGKLLGGKGGGKKGAPVDDRMPGERRIGIYGPSSVGKSVFFTMLYQACSMSGGRNRASRDFNLSPANPQTGAMLKNNLDTLRGGEWLPGTVEESALEFKATLSGGKQFPFSTRDYKGETVDLEQEGAAREKLIEYFRSCDGILFMIAPEMIADPRKCEREIMSFTAMINQVTDDKGRGLKIPIGLMITKADELEGFENDTQVELVARKSEYLKAKDFEDFVDGVCGQFHVARNMVFQESVRKLLYEMTMFFDFLMTLSMEFQVFFVSSVGHVRKIEDTPGKIVARPPESPAGIGVEKPFLWIVDTIKRKERIARFNAARRFVFAVSFVLLLFFAIPYAIHMFSARVSLEEMQSEQGQALYSNQSIEEELDRYANSLGVKLVSGLFSIPGTDAPRLKTSATKLVANWQLERQLHEEMPGWEDRDQLEPIAEPQYNGNGRWKEKDKEPEWYPTVGGRQLEAFDLASTHLVNAHNDRALIQLLDRVKSGDSEAIASACADVEAFYLQPPGDDIDDYDLLVQRLKDDCARWQADGAARALVDEALTVFEQTLTVYRGGTFGGGDLDPGREALDAFMEKSERLADDPAVAAQRKRAQDLIAVIRATQNAIQAADRENYQRYQRLLGQVRSAAGSRFAEVSSWAQNENEYVNGLLAGSVLEDLKAQVQLVIDNRPYELLDESKLIAWEERVRRGGISGAPANAVRGYREAFDSMRAEGFPIEIEIRAKPADFWVLKWDNQEAAFDLDQYGANEEIETVARIGEEIMLGLVRHGGEPQDACRSDRMSLGQLLRGEELRLEFDDCPGTGGDPVVIRPVGLAQVIEDRLAAPLRAGFGL